MKRSLMAGIALVALVGCGGGGDDGTDSTPIPQTASAEGMWSGTTSRGSNVLGFVLDDGTFYGVYTEPYSQGIVGIIQGSGSSNNGTYTVANGIDYYFGSQAYVSSASISGTYVSMQSLTGTVRWPNGETNTFDATYDTRYDETPSLTAVAGTYSGEVVGGSESLGVNGDYVTATISAGGLISGTSTYGCNFSGTVVPRTHGNVYNASVRMGGYPCLFPNQTLTGVLFYDSDEQLAFSAVKTPDRSGGLLLYAQKQ